MSDADKDKNAEIRYSITNNKGNTEFAVNAITGSLTLVKSLDREKKEIMDFELTASDLGTPSRKKLIQVRVIVGDVNDNTPRFVDSSTADVEENVPAGTNVIRVQATDADKGIDRVDSYILFTHSTVIPKVLSLSVPHALQVFSLASEIYTCATSELLAELM